MSVGPLAALEADATFEAGTRFLELAVAFLAESAGGELPVTPSTLPETLAARFDEALPLGGAPLESVLARVRSDVAAESIRLSHPMYLGHQVSAPLPAGIWSELIASAINNSLAVREMSPAGTVVEAQVVRWMCELAGFGPESGGTFTSGGTEATFTALLAARAACMPDAWEHGVGANPPFIVCGEHAHYAVSRAAGELGLGMSRVVRVPSREHAMDVAELERTLDRMADERQRVMAVVATAGSTATGSFDDLAAIGELCEARGLWLHVDAAHGASALLSGKHRHRLGGIGHARSIAWDPHKMMLLPLSAGTVIMRREADLETAFAQQAPYLFHGSEGRRWDQGTRSFQCSRRFDALKVWVALQRYGADGIAGLHDLLCQRAQELYEAVVAHPDFEAVHAPQSNILCFRFTGGATDPVALDDLNRRLRAAYNRSGEGWITLTVLDGRPVLRVTVMNPRTGPAHLARLLEQLAGEARRLLAAPSA
ncbi:MAG TPA: pyridoxal-dependent decarboxylase [Gemmatimonadales bacterium]|nr:pyridoxal-dependent decarboxylase [Gemmatimonadales bacterium]